MATILDRAEWNALDPERQFQLAYSLWSLTENYERVMREIPECPDHGALCTSHAVEWLRHLREAPTIIKIESGAINK
jgi:hypothetical protein